MFMQIFDDSSIDSSIDSLSMVFIHFKLEVFGTNDWFALLGHHEGELHAEFIVCQNNLEHKGIT